MSSNITDVQRGAGETGSASSQVLSAAQSLSGESNRLKLEVGKFLDTVLQREMWKSLRMHLQVLMAQEQAADNSNTNTKASSNAVISMIGTFVLTFTHTFEHHDDKCFFAYCLPYTYTDLQVHHPHMMVHPHILQSSTASMIVESSESFGHFHPYTLLTTLSTPS